MIDPIANSIAVIGSAAFSGVMICIGVTLGGFWRSLPPQDFLDWFAVNNSFVARSVPMTVVPAFLGLGGSIWTDRGTTDAWLWGLSTVCMAIVMVMTARFFVPANRAFAGGKLDTRDVPRQLQRWLSVHAVRIALGLTAAIIGCIATQG